MRLRGGREKIAKLLEDAPRFMLITYQQLPRVRELIAAFLAQHKTHVYLDESHRIKSGAERQPQLTFIGSNIDRAYQLNHTVFVRHDFRVEKKELRQQILFGLGHGRAGHDQLANLP